MTSPYKMFKTDEVLETKGIVQDFGDFKITIARAGGANKKFAKASEEKFRPHRRALEAGLMSEELTTKILAEVFADSVILGWENVTDENGQPMEFTRENVIKLLTDLPELFTDIRAQATKLALYRRDDTEAAVKNS